MLLRTIWLSMDPYQRNWMAGASNYGTAAAPGATVIGRAVSEVIASNDLRFVPGDIVCGDQDGLLAIPQDGGVLELIEKARGVLVSEAKTIEAMKEGRWDRSFIDALEARCNN